MSAELTDPARDVQSNTVRSNAARSTSARSTRVRLAGAGVILPGPDGVCADLKTFWEIVHGGLCCLSPYEYPGSPLRIAGLVHGWDPARELEVGEKFASRTARASLLALGAVRAALADAGLAPEDLDDGRTVLVSASLQFAFAETGRYFDKLAAGGPAALGMDYWMTGTPPAVLGSVATTLGIKCPTLNIAGSCNVPLRAVEVVLGMFRSGDADRAVIVGVDTAVDPVYVSSATYTSRQGYRASSLSADPASIRPHDELLDGNATGEGAVAVILENAVLENPEARGAGEGAAGTEWRIHTRTSRSNGPSVVATGPPDRVADDIVSVLAAADRSPDRIAFVDDYADGNRFVEDHFCAVVARVRETLDYAGPLTVTNQEAAFGHVAGIGGLVRLLGTLMMLERGSVGPVVNCREPYRALAADSVVGAPQATGGDAALVVAAGAGGDATTLLVERLTGGLDA
ncbi:MAG TPA: beta-ketoacyl synthase N-terminal-like domain-containing protein [Actinocrinis sp.]|jgi:act minimal PKS ketosynthase (KS/KS alpha)|uniref:beta-ketoacyl synthase N-terminal-like domain-containing protein n=1 Tax=Actinocrinis sp. TaxID=1920516 RepID=UPI002DDD66A9|nr:beta-ketoacyl synthase N-terminal-like domain-containing protein [Actinocrinis sp.]HEV3170468.1 beta-ketoacyl synthase N-terminal-like domain-containing protein [Actinocrinis sp.]